MFVSIDPAKKKEELPKMLSDAEKAYLSMFGVEDGSKSLATATLAEVFMLMSIQMDVLYEAVRVNVEQVAARAFQAGVNEGLKKIALPGGRFS